MKYLFYFLSGFIFVYFFFPASTFAARSLSVETNKLSLFGDEEMILIASSSGFTDGETIYIKGAFYQDGCSSSCNYFGYTKNGDNWIKNGESTLDQKSIQIGQWDGSIIAKSDFTDSGYSGEGTYKFKIGFYYLTSSGNVSSVNWSSNNLDINLNEPDPTPTNSPTPAPTSTPANTPTPTKAPTPTKTPTSTPIPNTPTSKPSATPTIKILPTSILGESTQSGEIISPTDLQSPNENILISDKSENTSKNWLQKIFIGIGGILLIACAILIFRFYINGKQEEA